MYASSHSVSCGIAESYPSKLATTSDTTTFNGYTLRLFFYLAQEEDDHDHELEEDSHDHEEDSHDHEATVRD